MNTEKQIIAQGEEKPKPGNCFRCVMYHSGRCRNRWFGDYTCPDGMEYEEYAGSKVKQCLFATVEIFQDGFIHCPIINETGCEHCLSRLRNDRSSFHPDESQNYYRLPHWIKKGEKNEETSM